jgi:NAD(P)-dependent dehydrogenase (short-subunit alcohol dehydrogenase family)
MMRVLVTGMSGLIGSALRARLAGGHELRALNRGRLEGVPCHQADIADLEAIRPAFDGVDVVVLCAGKIAYELEAERERNMIREDTFVSASIMGQRGMYGVPPRVGPAIQSPKRIEKPVNQYPAWDANLTWADKQEFELEWKTAAERAGVGMAKAQQDFLMEIAKRRVPLQDDPFSN